ncbi:amidohydrolase family protein [Corynebacterium sanguinis]|uniref:amidohydrolase family protein n=1 Tax=Corynebacterium sanguinis TaxID=2594913 RepID=UPI00264EAF06|nr:amidohydrolase family protein [Corynebacterium sanguinis]MDN8622665.1 amidohydrolase family protein [Corynebacterium sanguinis]
MTDSTLGAVSATAITNTRVFDGHSLSAPTTVVIQPDGRIGDGSADAVVGATVVNAEGTVLLPGLIDCHIHLKGRESLETLATYGVTTGLDMATWPASQFQSLRGLRGVADFRTAGMAATSQGSTHSRIPTYPDVALVDSPDKAERFVEVQVADGVDYIKIIADLPGPTQDVLDALVAAAHARGLKVIAHAALYEAVRMSLAAGADIITHAPLDRALDDATAETMLAQGTVFIPTLTMMEGIAANLTAAGVPGVSYAPAHESTRAMHAAGVPVLAGTDAGADAYMHDEDAYIGSFTRALPTYGESMHDELALLVDAGLSTAEALRAATSTAAHAFSLDDRGAITPGLRADLVLVDGDPLTDIAAARRVLRVWCGGIEV